MVAQGLYTGIGCKIIHGSQSFQRTDRGFGRTPAIEDGKTDNKLRLADY